MTSTIAIRVAKYFFIMKILVYLSVVVIVAEGCKNGKPLFGGLRKVENKPIEFDFASPKYPNVETILPKQSVELVLKNVPVHAYEITIKDSTITTASQAPAIFSQLFKIPELTPVPAEAPKTDDRINDVAPRAGVPAIGKTKEKAQQDELQAVLDEYAAVETGVKEIIDYSSIPQELKRLLLDCSSTQPQITAKTITFIRQKITALNSAAAAAVFPMGIEPTITAETQNMTNRLNALETRAGQLKKKYQEVLDNAKGDILLEEFRSLSKSVNEKIALIDKALTNLKTLKNSVAEFDKAKVGNAIVDVFNVVIVSRKEITKVIPGSLGMDELFIQVNIKKKGEINCAKEISGFPIAMVARGGVKIDFSTGLVFNLGQRYFFDQEYHFDSVYRADKLIADSVIIVRDRNNNVLIPSLGVFMNIYRRGLGQCKIGGVLGASIGTDQRVYYHVGGALMFGKSDRFVLGFGASVADAQRLDGQYSEGQVFRRSLAPSSIPTETATRIGGFLSFAYNLNLTN